MNSNNDKTFSEKPPNISNSIEEVKLAIAQINSKNHSISTCPSKSDASLSAYHEETIRKLKQDIADLKEKMRNDSSLWVSYGKQPHDA